MNRRCEHGVDVDPDGWSPCGLCGLCDEPKVVEPRPKVTSAKIEGLGDSGGTRGSTPGTDFSPAQTSSGDTGTRTIWTAAELNGATFPPPKWAVSELLPEGLTVLAGAPKIGKSWFVLALALDAAAGQPVLGMYPTAVADVLYLALEDVPRRLQSRMRMILGDRSAPATLTLCTEADGWTDAVDVIRTWARKHPSARLVIIDVYARIRPATSTSVPQYETDYRAGAKLKTLADELGLCIIAVHHTREAQADDFLDAVSGSRGLTGAADAVLVLARKRGEITAALNGAGRDVPELTLTLGFDQDTGRWTSSDPIFPDGSTKKVIHDYVAKYPDGVTPKWIADGTGLPHETVKKTCRRLADGGHLLSDDGKYRIRVPVSPEDEEPGQTACPGGQPPDRQVSPRPPIHATGRVVQFRPKIDEKENRP